MTAECKPGTYLNLTYDICLPCPVSYYQSKQNAVDCVPCPTINNGYDYGRASFEQCKGTVHNANVKLIFCLSTGMCFKGMCEPGSFSSSGFQPCDQCSLGTYQPDRGRLSCVSCGSGITTAFRGSQLFQDCTFNGNNLSNIALSGNLKFV